MGKILKYCGSCEEGFAERFTFCPDCGASLQTVELNPVASDASVAADAEIVAATAEPSAPAFIAEEAPETIAAPKTPEPTENGNSDHAFDAAAVTETFDTDFTEHATNGYKTGPLETPEELEDAEPENPEVTAAAAGSFFTAPEMDADGPRSTPAAPSVERADDGGYYVTVIQEKNSKQRNTLLLGAAVLVLASVSIVTLVSLFSKEMFVGSINDNPLFSAVLLDEVPMMVEEELQEKDKDEGGGGGGGGKDEDTPASRGDLPDMAENPTRPPDVNTPRFETPSMPIPLPQIQGPPMRTPKEYGKWGNPDGLDGPPSNGPGSGGGIGSGDGTGVGSGRGTGAGSGVGSGLGDGIGDGIGNGRGRGTGPPPVRAAVTENFKITSKPQAKYTDAGRTNSVQGTVRLKVTLLASGSVGNITPVTRLPHGMTEQAIAAARRIRFTPKRVNGVPQSVIVTVEYNFNLY